MAHHPWAVRRAFVYIAELLLDQRADLVAVMPMILRQGLTTPDLGVMGAALVALVGDPVIGRKYRQHGRCSEPWSWERTGGTRYHCFPFAHAAPLAERSAGPASIIIERHF